MGLTIGSALVAAIAGILVRGVVKKIAANKKKSEERALAKTADGAAGKAQADTAAKANVAAKKREERAKAKAKKYTDFLTSLEGSRPV